MAKPNYSYEKRQRDLAKKKQQEEKRLKKHSERPNADTVSPAEITESPTGTTPN